MPRKTKKAKLKAVQKRKELKKVTKPPSSKVSTLPKKVITPSQSIVTPDNTIIDASLKKQATATNRVTFDESTAFFKKDLSKTIFLSILLLSAQVLIYFNQQYNWFQINLSVFQ